MDSKPILHLSPTKEMKCLFLYYVQHLMISQACRWTWTPSTTCLQPKNEMLIFWLCSTSDVGQTGQWTQTPSSTSLQPKKMKCLFLDYVHFWWSAWLIDELEPHLPLLCSQKNEMLIFVLHSTSDVGQTGQWTQTPSTIPLQPKKWNAHFWITFNFWWSAGLLDGLEPSPPPISSQKNEMLIFGLCSTSDDQPGWSMDSNPIHHPSPGKKWNAHFWIAFTSDDRLGWLMNLNPICHSSPAKKWNAHSLIMFKFWWSAWLVNRLKTHLPPLSSQKNEMLLFGLCSLLIISQAGWWTRTPSATPFHPIKWNASFWIAFTSDDQPGWLMDSNPICHPSPANKMKCFFLDYVHFRWSARLVDGLKPYPSPVSSQ